MPKDKIKDEHRKVLEEIWKTYPNVVGFSLKYQKKIVDGQETEEPCLRIYVSKKVPKDYLTSDIIIPSSIDGIKTDVVEIGEVKILPFFPLPKAKVTSKTEKVRPVVLGVSIGNESITAGTVSFLMKDRNGNVVVSSNAHVFTDGDPSKQPEQIEWRKILQPGKYDGGTLDDWVATYLWHKPIIPLGGKSNCPIGKIVCDTYNFFSNLLGRKTLLQPVIRPIFNKIDFAVATPFHPSYFENRLFDEDNLNNIASIGLLFAGSETSTIVCKMTNILQEGYSPLPPFDKVAEAKEGITVYKTGRTTCKTSGTVLDSAGVVNVSYGSYIATFEDVIISDMKSAGGDSITGDARTYYLENDMLKFGTIEEIYNSFNKGNQISILTLKRKRDDNSIKTKYPTLGDAYVSFSKSLVLYHGLKHVWKVTLHNGKTIEITEDHSLFTTTGGSPTNTFYPSTLKELKNVVTVEDYDFEGIELNITDDFLILLGLWMADGSYEKREDGRIKGICISTGNEKGILSFLEKFNFRPKSKGDYRKDSVELAQFIYKFFGDVDCYTKRVPIELFTASKRQIGLFLKGYFSGDGSIHTQGSDYVMVDCSSVNRGLLEDVQILLNRLGIRCNIDDGYIPTRLSERRQYKLRIEGRINVEKFLKYVGMLKEIDTRLYEILNEQKGSLEHERGFSLRSIRSIKYVGEKPVYDFKVNPTEIFIANGITCHNSGSPVWCYLS
jgi:intein/homing endonuclease